MEKLDLKDKKIIKELDMDAKIPIKKLAKKVQLSRQVVLYRIKKLQQKKIIAKTMAIFDSAVIGQRWFRVILRMGKISKEQKIEFINQIKMHPNILWLGEVGGNWDFVLNFVTQDQFSFDKLFQKILEQWGNAIQKYEVLIYINVNDQSREYILEENPIKRKSLFHEMKFNSKIKLDELDKKIIKIISKNAWLSNSEIAQKLNINYKTVQNRIKEMEKNKLILGYRTFIHPEKIGYENYMIFLETHEYNPELEKQMKIFLNNPNITFVVKQLGKWRIGLEIEVKNRGEFQNFLVELRTRFGEIISEYETFPIIHDHEINYFPEGALE